MEAVLDSVYDFWKSWFDQPDEIKAELKHGEHGSGGWYPYRSEGPGLMGDRDPKEYFHFRTNHFNMHSRTAELFNIAYETVQKSLASCPELLFPKENHVLRIIRYFDSTEELAGDAHKDFNLFTVAFRGTKPGLQIFTDPVWIDADPKTLHIQAGEMAEIYSAGKLPAITHRVKTDGSERLVAVFFYNPDLDFELRPGYTAKDYLNEVLPRAGTLKELLE